MAAPIPPAEISVKDLEQIFREHHGLVFRAAYRITANAGDAEDGSFRKGTEMHDEKNSRH